MLLDELRKNFYLPLRQVSKEVKICITQLKKLCRRYHIGNWPFRTIRKIVNEILAVEAMIYNENNSNISLTIYQGQREWLFQALERVIENPNETAFIDDFVLYRPSGNDEADNLKFGAKYNQFASHISHQHSDIAIYIYNRLRESDYDSYGSKSDTKKLIEKENEEISLLNKNSKSNDLQWCYNNCTTSLGAMSDSEDQILLPSLSKKTWGGRHTLGKEIKMREPSLCDGPYDFDQVPIFIIEYQRFDMNSVSQYLLEKYYNRSNIS